jgi:hypothetical protein
MFKLHLKLLSIGSKLNYICNISWKTFSSKTQDGCQHSSRVSYKKDKVRFSWGSQRDYGTLSSYIIQILFEIKKIPMRGKTSKVQLTEKF